MPQSFNMQTEDKSTGRWKTSLWDRQVPGSWARNATDAIGWTNPATAVAPAGPAQLLSTRTFDLRPDGTVDPLDRTRAHEDDVVASLDPRVRPYAQLNLDATRGEQDRQLDQQGHAIEGIQATQGRLQEAQTGWQNNPQYASVLQTLDERSQSGYDVISETQQAAQQSTLSQAYARQLAAAEVRRGGSGMVATGSNQHQDALLDSYYTGAGLQVAAQRDALNEQARTGALDALGGLTLAGEGVTQGYINADTQLSANLANVRMGLELEPTDFVAFGNLDFALDAYDKALVEADENQAFAEDQAGWQITDIFDGVLKIFTAFPGLY